ncbi:hypothetical protein RCL1_005820 [Eukaryota sp. TZLM3-RCL]
MSSSEDEEQPFSFTFKPKEQRSSVKPQTMVFSSEDYSSIKLRDQQSATAVAITKESLQDTLVASRSDFANMPDDYDGDELEAYEAWRDRELNRLVQEKLESLSQQKPK